MIKFSAIIFTIFLLCNNTSPTNNQLDQNDNQFINTNQCIQIKQLVDQLHFTHHNLQKQHDDLQKQHNDLKYKFQVSIKIFVMSWTTRWEYKT